MIIFWINNINLAMRDISPTVILIFLGPKPYKMRSDLVSASNSGPSPHSPACKHH